MLARRHGVDTQARAFSPWSHVVALLYAQLKHALSLNDVCDGLLLWCTPLRSMRGATAPARNTLSHANKTRPCALAQDLFWEVLKHLQTLQPGFGGRHSKGLAWRFKATIHVVDSTVISLVANCLDWAKHRRRKAAAKCHLRMGLHSMLPGFVVIDTAKEHDNLRAHELCAGLQDGEIVLFDKGYYDLEHFRDLTERGVFFVTRAKDNLACKVCQALNIGSDARILADELVELTGPKSQRLHPGKLRRVRAEVQLDGQTRILVFLTNNLTWSAGSVADLYRCRWQIEVFFKQIKQTLQLADFLGHNANAVRWQLWTALLVYVLLRFMAHLSRWGHSFSRLWGLCRSMLWGQRELLELLEHYGTAKGRPRPLPPPQEPVLPGFEELFMGQPT